MTIQEEGNSNTGMWGHYCETSSVYKRTPSRDYSSMTDVEENSVNEPLGSIYLDLGFSENTLAEGLVVSICLGGALIGCLLSGWIADGVGRCRAFQLCALPMIIGSSTSAATNNLFDMLVTKLFVGTGLGLGPPVASLCVAEISPTFVRGTYGALIQNATCLGLMGALFIGIPVHDIPGWYNINLKSVLYCYINRGGRHATVDANLNYLLKKGKRIAPPRSAKTEAMVEAADLNIIMGVKSNRLCSSSY
ncbi:hypothetical protein RIF29_38021 [Crotalaria pallida]|uniref:Major facilitator superfamily (MFS) profile domain-containing protein n=1 Tax=Crotalaria pallida TaxID=3830 RepID=A0AAN9DZ74_CROPI